MMESAGMDGTVLPSIMFTTAAQIVDFVDKRLIVVLRDGRKLIGVLRSFDQYANFVLQDTIERIIVGKNYSDVERGVYLIRGENVVLAGELDPQKDDTLNLKEIPIEQIYAAQDEETELQKQMEFVKSVRLAEEGFLVDTQ
ncbi:uncharacterized protein V1516DRAFT_671483 [Lipomyces oligophaga]|uniref:uncharacterized protein n=1 Tax=Lipomyces oligophaga TaxID=45792 RepID=UPI0034CFFF47